LNDETIQDVLLIDYARAYKLMGLEPPNVTTDAQLEEFKTRVAAAEAETGVNFGFLVRVGYLHPLVSSGVRPSAIGFSPADVSGHVIAGRQYVSMEEARFGNYPSQYEASARVDRALRDCHDCGLTPSIQSHSDTVYVAWGEDRRHDLRRLFDPPAFDDRGFGGRLTVNEYAVLRGRHTPDIEAMIDASLDITQSLADSETFRLVAQTLDDAGVVLAHMTCTSYSLKSLQDQAAEEPGYNGSTGEALAQRLTKPGPALRPYLLTGTGTGHESGEDYMVIVLAHRSHEDAVENSSRVRQRLEHAAAAGGRASYAKYTSLSVAAEGTLVIARLGGMANYYRDYDLALLLVREE
jgi:hypothetical protein